jgi:hypothetical protein
MTLSTLLRIGLPAQFAAGALAARWPEVCCRPIDLDSAACAAAA